MVELNAPYTSTVYTLFATRNANFRRQKESHRVRASRDASATVLAQQKERPTAQGRGNVG